MFHCIDEMAAGNVRFRSLFIDDFVRGNLESCERATPQGAQTRATSPGHLVEW